MSSADMFRPPINRAMRELDRSFFQRRIPISAARLGNPRDIGPSKKALEKSKDLLGLAKLQSIRPDPSGEAGRKCLLLKPEIKHDGRSIPSPTQGSLS
jgi:tRNA (guanine37-N1)-methyltransferase